ncbi:hypothetical protein CDAR_283691 [Caerostris darwini]|uniref:Uncharacterized protein n=1 Tax=Caerostris darwini TaxID=1538125 RepID=A0AAV4MF76_9ARAC|nr:hypothetical protein CDAR_283691 [Caerostris darwini]
MDVSSPRCLFERMALYSSSFEQKRCGCKSDQQRKIELGVRPDFGPGAVETADDEWWRRMERAETIDYSVRASTPGASNPELMDTTSASIHSELLASPTFPEKQSNLSDEEHCARITTVIKKKNIAQNLYDAMHMDFLPMMTTLKC